MPQPDGPRVCISYRRSDSMAITGRIFDRLVAHFGGDAIFMDIDDIPFGVDFREHIDRTLRKSDILVAVVGPQWLGPRAGGTARIREPADPVAIEIRTALEQHLHIVPVLVDGTKMPDESDLPDSLREFADLNAVDISSGRDFSVHMDRLIRAIVTLSGKGTAPAVAPPAGPAPAVQVGPAAGLALLAIGATLAAHYMIVIKLDLADVTLRTAVLVIGAGFGGLAYRLLGRNFLLVLSCGLAVSILSVLGMLTVVGLIDGVSIVPASVLEWQEAAEYVATILVGVGIGGAAARLMTLRKPAQARPEA